MIVQPVVEPMDQFAALHQARAEDHRPPAVRGSAAALQPPGHDRDGLPAEAGLSLALLDRLGRGQVRGATIILRRRPLSI